MLHRPPSINPEYEQESRKNSYQVSEDDLKGDKLLIKQTEPKEELSSVKQITVLQELNNDSVKLPEELFKEFDNFIKFLKLPKFNRPLNLDDVSKLYQQFYEEFNNKNIKHWQIHYGYMEYKETELLTKEEINDRNERLLKITKSVYLSNLLIEKLVCNKYYKKIFKSDKNLVKDELNNLINEKFNNKLQKLNKLNLKLTNLDLELELTNEQELIDQLSPIYKDMFETRSPTLKLLKFKKIHEEINQFLKKLNIKINGDYYLPILIYSMTKIKQLQDYNLILELNFIKNFKNNTIYENNNSNETGELLYILTNLDACLIYLSNVTIDDLKLDKEDYNDEDASLIKPISIDESSLTYCEDYNMIKKNSKNNSALDYYSTRLQEYAFYNADQGIRTIGNAFDSSVKTVFGRFLPSSSPSAEIDKQTLSQIEENFNNRLNEDTLSPISTTSTLNTLNSSPSASSSSNGHSIVSPQQQQQQQQQQPQLHQRSNSNSNTLKNFSSSMSGVIKQFRPISNSNSSTSLHTTMDQASDNNVKTRSRGTSLIGEVFSGSHNTNNGNQFPRSSSAGFLNTIEHAFEGRRSRGNSLLGSNIISDLKKEYNKDEMGKKKFEDMSINELKKMFDNYNKIMNS